MLQFLALFVGFSVGTINAFASATHLAKVDVELGWLSPSGRFESLVDKTLDYRLDWNSRKCEVQLNGIYYYCVLDVESDLIDREGNVLMKQVPVAYFGYKSLDALLLVLGREHEELGHLIGKVVKETSDSRASGFRLPFYTCENCVKNGEQVPVWNAYDSYVRRILEVKHPAFSGRKLALVMKIRKMQALGGAFNIIGRTNADSYIPDLR